ncbi:MAG: ATP-binding cassette domain-containing protein [Cytophagales bacterium]|nr:ATP-binding cassette domain-containing protein [Cytophagales bacterium]
MIEIKDIKKSFGDKEILKGISGKFEPGKTNLIIGGSGTGKSVLLKCIIGIHEPTSGEILYNGRDFVNADKRTLKEIRREIGMLFQGSALFDSKTVLENVLFPMEMMTDMSAKERLERAEFCLERVELSHAGHLYPSEISGGMQKRVGIARAIVLNPRYLFCDEPNSGLDPQTAITIDELIQEITEEYNITTVIVSHDMNSVMGIGQYIMYLYKGLKLWEGSNKTLLDTEVKELQEFIFSSELVRDLKNRK